MIIVLWRGRYAPHCCGFEYHKGFFILSFDEAIQLADRTLVVLLRCSLVPEIMHLRSSSIDLDNIIANNYENFIVSLSMKSVCLLSCLKILNCIENMRVYVFMFRKLIILTTVEIEIKLTKGTNFKFHLLCTCNSNGLQTIFYM